MADNTAKYLDHTFESSMAWFWLILLAALVIVNASIEGGFLAWSQWAFKRAEDGRFFRGMGILPMSKSLVFPSRSKHGQDARATSATGLLGHHSTYSTGRRADQWRPD